MWTSIRNKIVLFTVIPITLVYSIIFAVYIWGNLQQARGSVETFMEQQAGHFAGLINSQLQFVEAAGRAVSRTCVPGRTNNQCRLLIANALQEGEVHTVLSGEPGRGAVYTLKDNRLVEQSWEEGGWPAIKINHWGWSLPIKIPLDNKQHVIYQVPDKDLYFSVPVATLFAALGRDNPRKLRFEIVNRESHFIYSDMRSTRPDRSLRDTAERINSEALRQLVNVAVKNGIKGTSTVYFRDWPTWYFASPIPEAGWVLLTHIRETHALTDAMQSAISSGFFLLMALFVVTACIFKVSEVITNPLVQLSRAVDKLGNENWTLNYRHRAKDETGHLAERIAAMALRLSERDEALKEMRASNISHMAASLRGHYFYYTVDEHGGLSYISPSVRDILGYSTNNLLGAFKRSFIGPKQYRLLKRAISAVLSGRTDNETLQLDFPHKSGMPHTIELVNVPVVEPDGRISGVEGMGHDVTELISDSKKFRGLLEAAPDAILIITKDQTITMVNQRAESLFGYRQDELIGESLIKLGRGRNKSPFPQRITEAHYTGEPLNFESFCSKKEGKPFPVEVAASPLRIDAVMLVIIIIRDTSNRKQAERELRRARDQARAADKTKSEFLASMSHELRTPLESILEYVRLMRSDTGLSEEQNRSLDVIRDCGQHLLLLINDVLDLARMASTTTKVRPEPVNLYSVLERLCKQLQLQAKKKGLDVLLSYDPGLPDYVLADVTKLRQVLINLLGNGLKFTEEGHVQLKVLRDDDQIMYIVSDTGFGIAAEEQESIFSPFQQASIDNHPGGTGLGLTISQRLVTAMGGHLSVASSPGYGSRFYFSLPLQEASGSNA